MTLSTAASRLKSYYRRRGFVATLKRMWVALNRSLFSRYVVLFYSDLATQTELPQHLSSSLRVERKRNSADLSPEDVEAITSASSPKLVINNMKQRFALGASLWLIKSDDKLAGYGWTLQGNTVEPHYYSLGKQDVHLFDFHVFEQFRGRGINPSLVNYILRDLAAAKAGRAFIEAAEWNRPQLSSLAKTPFCRMGRAGKWTIFDRTVVCWGKPKTG